MRQDTNLEGTGSQITAFGFWMIGLGIFFGYWHIVVSTYFREPSTVADSWTIAVCALAVLIGFVSGIVGYIKCH
jgi:hypothetical protein